MTQEIEALFSKLQTSPYRITSPRTRDYNCIAWAAGDTRYWWWPDADPDNDAIFWPAAVAREETVAAFQAAFATLGYQPCPSDSLEPGFEKVALFVGADGLPSHAARQLPDGRWTSKLGRLEDIEHTLQDLSGDAYGTVAVVLRRPGPLADQPAS
jgi:hypothetical protein